MEDLGLPLPVSQGNITQFADVSVMPSAISAKLRNNTDYEGSAVWAKDHGS